MALFDPCMKIKSFLAKHIHLKSFMKFIHEALLAPSMCLFRLIKMDKYIGLSQKGLTYFYFSIEKFLACLEHGRSYTWSFSHSDPDPNFVQIQAV
jgi:hypothetical protein